jgi:GT2 family glycosyltransferase/glycosyltransferase involved in cell wall biosynthesis
MKPLITTLLEAVFLLTLAPVLLVCELVALWLTDLCSIFVPKRAVADTPVNATAVSVVIPTWNGRSHLEANLHSVVAAIEDYPDSEILVVDNGSDDGSAAFIREAFPSVRVLEQNENLGFGGGSNVGFETATNDIVVLLNNDMRVEKDFLAPLLKPFEDSKVFGVSAQILFSDPEKRREETGLTAGRWTQGRLALGHVLDDSIDRPFPIFYAGGGSTAYDRRKFLEVGGFDELLRPFYMEDVDVSYIAWKRGWKVLYAAKSVVYHEHRGTIGKHFGQDDIERIVHQNHLLFLWKNIHEPGRLIGHLCWTWLAMGAYCWAGPGPMRPSPRSFLSALVRTLSACRSRMSARRLAEVGDTEALRRPLGGYYRDRFAPMETTPAELNVLFVSPYSMAPPIHGGAVFMNETVTRLQEFCRLHLLCLVDEDGERASNLEFGVSCASVEVITRWKDHSHSRSVILPHAVQHFWHPEFEWNLHKKIYQKQIDVLQLEYTQLAIYGPEFKRIGSFLFEHDIYFQSVWRGIAGETSSTMKWKRFYEYLRALRFERRAIQKFDEVQLCTRANRRFLETYLSESPPLYEGLRAGIDVSRYAYVDSGRETNTLLFVGNFKHPPNQEALTWFVRQVLPAVIQKRRQTRLVVVGAQATQTFVDSVAVPGVEFVGAVDDIREPLSRYSVFLAPILTGSGVRVKLLEAFAVGIPVVSTRLGAEGLTEATADIVALADNSEEFTQKVLQLLENPQEAQSMAKAARREVEGSWDSTSATRDLHQHYLEIVHAKRAAQPSVVDA